MPDYGGLILGAGCLFLGLTIAIVAGGAVGAIALLGGVLMAGIGVASMAAGTHAPQTYER